jgi:cysteine desulfurase
MVTDFTARMQNLRDKIIDHVMDEIPQVRISGHRHHRLANHTSFAFKAIDSNQLLAALDLAGFACSSGSACKTGNPEPSPILRSLGYATDWALGALRVTLGRYTNENEVDDFLNVLPGIIERLRSSHLS